MTTHPFTRAEMEAGRKLFAGDWQFAAAAGSAAALPRMRGIEIAVAGRSNVGKSSLINALTGRRALARISHTPGRTQELIHAFLLGRANLARAYLLLDARHGLKPIDADVLETLDKAAVNYQIVLTKADATKSAELAALVAATKAALAKHPAAHPDVLVTSARTGAGIPELRSAIARLIRERGAA